MKHTLQSIREQSDKLHNRWVREFAGKPRHTRDLGLLEKLIEKAAGLAKKAKGIPGEKGDELEKAVRERLKLYTSERDQIAEAKYDRPEIGESHTLGMEIDRQIAVWRRHFSGRDRRTRDLPLLDMLIARLAPALARLEEIAPTTPDVVKPETLTNVRGQYEVLKDERSEIEKAKRAVPEAERPAMWLAEASAALDRYRVLLGAQPRATCSVAQLDHVIAVLKRVRADFRGHPGEGDNAQNVAVLEQNVAAYEAERPKIIEARATIEPRVQGSQLGAVANQMFGLFAKHFANQARVTRDLKLLSDICDRLNDLAEQMAELDRASGEPLNKKNLTVVEDRARRFEQEWAEIAKAKAQQAVQQQQQKAQPAPAVKTTSALKKPAPPPQNVGPQITIAPKKGES